MGDSAGGTLATVTALALRDQANPHLRGQILVYPITDHVDAGAASYTEFAEGYGLTRDGMRWFMRHYIADPADATDTRVCPVRMPTLRRLPPTFVVTAEYDVLRDEGERYVERLREDGVDVTFERAAGPAPRVHPPVRDPRGARAVDRSHRGVDASRLSDPMKTADRPRPGHGRRHRVRPLAAGAHAGSRRGHRTSCWSATPPSPRAPAGASASGSWWRRRRVVTNTAQNGRSSKSFRDEGHWATALAAKGDYYLIQFGHNDQPGKGPERETDPATTFPANMARYVDEVRAIGATPILVTSLVRRTFSETEPGDS